MKSYICARMNLLYFVLYFTCIVTFSALRFFSLDLSSWYFLYSFFQALFEVGVLILIAHFLKNRVWIFPIYLMILLLHYAHFTIHRLTDSTLSLFFKFFAGHGFAHIMTVFRAMNMNRSMIFLIIAAFTFLPMISIGLYRITARMMRPRKVSIRHILITLLPIGIFLCSFECLILRKMSRPNYEKYQKTLALGTTLFSPQIPSTVLSVKISPPIDQNEILKTFETCALTEKPNIYLFIIETLRKDFINEQIAPHLNAFRKENIDFAVSHANANSTQHSWFAIFHSLLPFHWITFPKVWEKGSVPLLILKKLGYKIHVYSSADLRYFDMDQMIFGPKRMLADVIEEYSNLPIESWEKDQLVIESFENAKKTANGNVFVFFLDATHSEYSFPPNQCYFQPIVEKIDYLTVNVKNIEPIINRYRNSVRYIDSLLDRFLSGLKREGLYKQAIIAITGDHGEEFFEEGSLFHGTHLNEAQTCVPILFKFPNHQLPILTNNVTHIDIFPTLLEYVTDLNCDLFEGKSIFRKHPLTNRFAIAQNGAKTPREFTVHNENYKLHARFLDPDNIYSNHAIEVLLETGSPEQIPCK